MILQSLTPSQRDKLGDNLLSKLLNPNQRGHTIPHKKADRERFSYLSSPFHSRTNDKKCKEVKQ